MSDEEIDNELAMTGTNNEEGRNRILEKKVAASLGVVASKDGAYVMSSGHLKHF